MPGNRIPAIGLDAPRSCAARVLVVGQTPPPITGQAVVVAHILAGAYPGISLRHVPMRFSAAVDAIGRFQWRKLVELTRVVALIAWGRFAWGADVLFYPPAGGNRVPIARDIAILALTRWMFPVTVLHFHARGVGAAYRRAPAALRPLFRLAYFGADLGVVPARVGADDAQALAAKRVAVIPNGVADEAGGRAPARRPDGPVRILYLSQVSPPKGILTLLDALALVAAARPGAVALDVVGPFASPDFRAELERSIRALGLAKVVTVRGELSGSAKSRVYAAADIFCFPSLHPTESFGLVAVEAMSFGLPVVAADWGAIRDIVDDGSTGILFAPGDPLPLAAALERLVADPGLRVTMGRRGRERYSAEFTLDRFRERLGAALLAVAPERRTELRSRSAGRAAALDRAGSE